MTRVTPKVERSTRRGWRPTKPRIREASAGADFFTYTTDVLYSRPSETSPAGPRSGGLNGLGYGAGRIRLPVDGCEGF